jgi:hypothetical protein
MVNKHNNFQGVLPSTILIPHKNVDFDVSQSTIEEILVHRSHVNYIKEHNKIIKLVDHLFKKNVLIQWSPFYMNNSEEGIKVENIILPITTIRDETDGEINDGHFSEKTQREVAEKLLAILDKGGSISNKLI